MIRYYILIIASVFGIACQPQPPLKEGPYAHPHEPNPGLTPLEKPNLEEDFYDAPRDF